MSRAQRPRRYTIRGVPDEVARVLRRRARQKRLSLNATVLAELAAATLNRRTRLDLSQFVGQWQDDPAFDAVIAKQRKFDLEKWS